MGKGLSNYVNLGTASFVFAILAFIQVVLSVQNYASQTNSSYIWVALAMFGTFFMLFIANWKKKPLMGFFAFITALLLTFNGATLMMGIPYPNVDLITGLLSMLFLGISILAWLNILSINKTPSPKNTAIMTTMTYVMFVVWGGIRLYGMMVKDMLSLQWTVTIVDGMIFLFALFGVLSTVTDSGLYNNKGISKNTKTFEVLAFVMALLALFAVIFQFQSVAVMSFF